MEITYEMASMKSVALEVIESFPALSFLQWRLQYEISCKRVDSYCVSVLDR